MIWDCGLGFQESKSINVDITCMLIIDLKLFERIVALLPPLPHNAGAQL